MKRLLSALVLSSCAPLIAGTSRVLPPNLQTDPADVASKAEASPDVPVERLVLENEVTVFWQRVPDSRLVDIVVGLGCGDLDDPSGRPGLTATTLEAAFVAGSSLEPLAQRAAFQALGTSPVASTELGFSLVRLSVLRPDFAAGLELLVDALAHPRFEPAPTLAVLERYAARPTSKNAEHLRRGLLPQGTGASQLLDPALIRSTPREAMVEHARRCVTPNRLVLGLSGDLDEDAIRAASKVVAGLQKGDASARMTLPFSNRTASLRLRPDASTRRATIAIAGSAGNLSARERVAATILTQVLSSSLLQELRSELGYVYSTRGLVVSGAGVNLALVTFTTRRERAFHATRRAVEAFETWWKAWPLTPQVVERVKLQLLAFERARSPASLVERRVERWLLDGPNGEARSDLEMLESIDAGALQQIFVKAFAPERRQLIVSGDVDPASPWSSLGAVEQ